jgi:acetyltransferase-like isoleucine patch superfamily enzyme
VPGVALSEIAAWLDVLLRFMPGRVGSAARRIWYARLLCSGGTVHSGIGCELVAAHSIRVLGTCTMGSYCYFNADGGSITMGASTAFNNDVHINAAIGGNIVIGSHCLIGPGVVMRTANHRYSRSNAYIDTQGHDCADIVIEDDCWVGAMAVILGGVTVRRGAVIGAGAVVTKDVPPCAVVAGVPARVIKFRGRGDD